jgi:hypothetical protein
MGPTTQLAVRVPPDVLAWLDRKKNAEERSYAFILIKLVRAEIEREVKAQAKKPKAA